MSLQNYVYIYMPQRGFEPPRFTTLDPKSSASTIPPLGQVVIFNVADQDAHGWSLVQSQISDLNR